MIIKVLITLLLVALIFWSILGIYKSMTKKEEVEEEGGGDGEE